MNRVMIFMCVYTLQAVSNRLNLTSDPRYAHLFLSAPAPPDTMMKVSVIFFDDKGTGLHHCTLGEWGGKMGDQDLRLSLVEG